jgi:hypothetical protein
MDDTNRYETMRSEWGSADEAFNWIVGQVELHNNGEAIDNYCLSLAVRDMICTTLIDVSSWDVDRAVEFVSAEGVMTAEIDENAELGRHLVLAWQPTGAPHAEVFVYALDIFGANSQDEEHDSD